MSESEKYLLSSSNAFEDWAKDVGLDTEKKFGGARYSNTLTAIASAAWQQRGSLLPPCRLEAEFEFDSGRTHTLVLWGSEEHIEALQVWLRRTAQDAAHPRSAPSPLPPLAG